MNKLRISAKSNIVIFTIVMLLSMILKSDIHSADVRTLINEGLEKLSAKKGDTETCVLTDASYVIINGKTTENYIDTIQQETGCSIGKGNLLLLHRSTDYPLLIALFKKETKDCVLITYNGDEGKITEVNITPEKAGNSEEWDIISAALGNDAFSIMNILNAWADGAPYDFLKCSEFHNHICPGLTSGYFIAKFIQKQYPLKDNESYLYISSPSWCKDDAMQILLDITPGKGSLIVKHLTKEMEDDLLSADIAGILIIQNRKKKSGKAVILEYSWENASNVLGENKTKTKLSTILELIPHLDKPELFVKAVKEFELDSEKIKKIKLAGVNPYKELGFIKK